MKRRTECVSDGVRRGNDPLRLFAAEIAPSGSHSLFALIICRLSAGARKALDMSALKPSSPPPLPALRARLIMAKRVAAQRLYLDTLERVGYFNIDLADAHDALADVRATVELYKALR